jgi:hypothetical protein
MRVGFPKGRRGINKIPLIPENGIQRLSEEIMP